MKVTNKMVEYWLLDDEEVAMSSRDRLFNKYNDALDKLTDLINEDWTHGNSDTMPTMKELREDISDLWGEYQYDIKNRGEEA